MSETSSRRPETGFSFFSASGYVMFENRPETEDKKQNKIRSRSSAKDKKSIVNPIFRDMKEFTDDPYWLNKLDEWANGKPCNSRFKVEQSIRSPNRSPGDPEKIIYSIKFTKKILNGKTKVSRVDLYPDDLAKSLIIFKSFLEEHVVAISDMDRKLRAANENGTHRELFLEKKKGTKNVLNTVEKSIELIDTFITNFMKELAKQGPFKAPMGEKVPSDEEIILSIKDSIKMIILTKNYSQITIDESKTTILDVQGLIRERNGLFRCEIPPVKPGKSSRIAESLFEQDDDDEKNLASMITFQKFLIKLTDK